MFGYVVINKPELKFREYDEYRSFYCGLCRSLKDRYGRSGQITLNYDLNFLAMLLSALYEPETRFEKSRCIIHPLKKQLQALNPQIDYCADMTIILSYYKCADDWQDEKKWTSRLEQRLLEEKMAGLRKKYPEKCETIRQLLEKNNELEKAEEKDLDTMANLSGRMMGTIFAWRKDEWEKTLFEIGFYLGKYIYLMDAWEDVEKDTQSGSFNLLKERQNQPDFNAWIVEILEMMMAACTEAFEMLPIFEYREILRNILYSGIWTKAALVRKKKEESQHAQSL